MIELAIPLMGLSIHILFWEKLPSWGNWFNTILNKLPKFLQKLYADWECAYCAGFWIALVLHAMTGLWTIPALSAMNIPILAWLIDALAAALLIYAGSFAVAAISLPAMRAYSLKATFMEENFSAGKDDDSAT